MKLSRSAGNRIIAGAAIALFLALAALSFFATERMARTQGPSRIGVAADRSLWIVSHASLHQLLPDGTRIARVPLAALGLGPVLSDVRPLRDGQLLLAQAVPSGLYRCHPVSARCERLAADVATQHALMVDVDEARARVVVADNAGHRLLLLDLATGRLLDETPVEQVLHPNTIAFDGADAVIVSDTDRGRIVRVLLDDDRFALTVEPRKVVTRELRPGRHWPMDFARLPSGEWWVLVAADRMKDADLVVHEPLGNAVRRIDLGERSDPTKVVSFAHGVLVAEPTRGDLLHLRADGTVRGGFGDDVFRVELAAAHLRHRAWTLIRDFGPAGMAVVPLVAIVILRRRGAGGRTPP
ncbi:MAG: hypothetical protein ACREVS_08685 [Burkholderiales bacterium]